MLAFLNNIGSRISERWTNFLRSLGNRFWLLINRLREGVLGRQRQGGYTPAQASSEDSMVTSREEVVEFSIDSPDIENNPNAVPSSAIVLLEESSGHPVDDLSLQQATLTLEEEALLKKAQEALKFLRWTEVYEDDILYLEELFEQGKLTQEQVNDRFNNAYKRSAKNEQSFMPAGSISVIESLHMELLGDKTMTYALYKEDLPRFEKQLQPWLKDYHPANNPLPPGIERIGQGEKAISIKRLQCRLTLVWISIVERMFIMYQKLENNARENEKWGMRAEEAITRRIESEKMLEKEKEKTEKLQVYVESVLAARATTEDRKPKQDTVKTRLGTFLGWSSPASTRSSEELKANRNGETDEYIGSSFRRSNTT